MDEKLYQALKLKAGLKQHVFRQTKANFLAYQSLVKDYADSLSERICKEDESIKVLYEAKGEFEFRLSFSGDVLIFLMHSNVFDFERGHRIKNLAYVKEDPSRAYCGIIHVFNFLADSFRYNRVNDPGQLIARIFINKDGNFFVEGKQQLGFLYHGFEQQKFDAHYQKDILENCMKFSLGDELLTPPFQAVQEASVHQMLSLSSEMRLKTAKKLGYRANPAPRNSKD